MSRGKLRIPDVFRSGTDVLKCCVGDIDERSSMGSPPPPPPPFTESSIAPSSPQSSRPSSPISTIGECSDSMSEVPPPPSPSSSMCSEHCDNSWIVKQSPSPETSLLDVQNPTNESICSLVLEEPPATADVISEPPTQLAASWCSTVASSKERLQKKVSTPHLVVISCYLKYTTVSEYSLVEGEDVPSFTCTPFENMSCLPSIAHVILHDCEEELMEPLVAGLKDEKDVYFLVSSSAKSSISDCGDLMKLARFSNALSEGCDLIGRSIMSHRRELETAYLAVETCMFNFIIKIIIKKKK